jgi:thymidylate synthase
MLGPGSLTTAIPEEYMQYRPYEDRVPDGQYHELLRRIVEEGEDVDSQQEARARMVVGHQMRFNLRNGFPLITERDLSGGQHSVFRQTIAEMRAFWLRGARTLAELEAEGCRFWAPWGTAEKCEKRGLEPGDLGPGSYGPAFRAFPTVTGPPFDQVIHVLEQTTQLPHLRTHFISPWIPQYIGRGIDLRTGRSKQQRVVVAPCHGWVHLLLNPERRTLRLHHFQRSGDVPVGVACNILGYAALTMMWAQVLGYEPVEYVHTISDAHVYLKQLPDVEDMLRTAPQRFPTVTLEPDVKDLFEFRPEHFTLSDYHPQLSRRRIWTPV